VTGYFDARKVLSDWGIIEPLTMAQPHWGSLIVFQKAIQTRFSWHLMTT
jgi:hypothetical protein